MFTRLSGGRVRRRKEDDSDDDVLAGRKEPIPGDRVPRRWMSVYPTRNHLPHCAHPRWQKVSGCTWMFSNNNNKLGICIAPHQHSCSWFFTLNLNS